MKSFKYRIKDELGLHARPAGMLVKEAKKYESKITVAKEEKTASATQLMMLMTMAVKKGSEVIVTAKGSDEDAACEAMEQFFRNNL